MTIIQKCRLLENENNMNCNFKNKTKAMHPTPKFNSFVLFWTCHKVKVFMDQIENHQNRPDSNPFSLFACYVVQPKSLYISPEVSHFYGTEYKIWAGFGLVGSTENCPPKLLLATFKGIFFMFLWAKKSCFFLILWCPH